MPRCHSTESPPSSRIRMYLPRRRNPAIRAPVSRCCRLGGNGQRKSGRITAANVITRPSRRVWRPRITVSTSGSSGMGGDQAIEGGNDRQSPSQFRRSNRSQCHWRSRRQPDGRQGRQYGRFRLPTGRSCGEIRSGACGLRQCGAQIRRDERSDVAGCASDLEADFCQRSGAAAGAPTARSGGGYRRYHVWLAECRRRAGVVDRHQHRDAAGRP